MSSDADKRIAALSPEKRALLLKQLRQQQQQQGARPARAPAIARRPRDGSPLPLSFAQQRLWFLDQLEPDSALYNIPLAIELKGELKLEALEQAFTALQERHESLRTTFRTVEGTPVQVIAPPSPVTLEVADLRGVAGPERQDELSRRVREESLRPFHLGRGPLVRASLVRTGDEEHVLLVTMHHAISDGWSMGVVIRELASLYDAYLHGRPSPLPPLELQYPDYAAWQREWLQGETLKAQLDWWKQQLEGAPDVIALPTDRPRPAIQSSRGAKHFVQLPRAVSEALKALGQKEGATPFMTLLAAWQVLLARYTGQDDISVGTPIAGRNRAELEGLIGFFINTLVLRAKVKAGMTFRQVLAHVREQALGAYAHQEVPFEKLVDLLQPVRTLSHSPLFQVMFSLQNAPVSELVLPDVALRTLRVEAQTTKFELTLSLSDTAEGFSGSIEYNTDLFDAGTVERMAGHLEVLLEAIAKNPDTKVAQLPLLTEAERRQQVLGWNATRTAFPREKCVHTLVTEQVERTPDAVALDFGGEQRTFRQVEARANQLAQRLVKQGVKRGSRVGLCVERGVGMVEGMLGILKAGGAYVPLDAGYPRERLAFMVEDAGVEVLVTQASQRGALPEGRYQVVVLDDGALDAEPMQAPENQVDATDPAYVIYTSGSTGRPKGVWVPHRAIVRLLVETNFIQLTAEDRIAQVSNASFDAATFEIWGVLLHGGRLVGVAKDVALSPAAFAAYLRDERISTLFVTSALFNQLVAQSAETFQTVRQLHVGGDAVDPGAARAVLARGAPGKFVNAYGPTESTTFAAWHHVKEVAEGATAVPIGRPLSNTELYVLDAELQPVPVGVLGELYIGGDGLALGYLGRPELTAEKFVPHPFRTEAGARLYRTGDQVKQLPDGSVVFLGRLDSQVKVRGFRIELGEVESALGQCKGVAENTVIAREDSPGIKRLVAYVGAPEAMRPTVDALRAELKTRLPEYMVPAAFVMLESLPLTPNGKVDRKALPAPQGDRQDSGKAYVAPRTPEEEKLAAIWASVLGLEKVGIHDNFFALGGDSIISIQIISRANQAGLRLMAKQLFQHQTVAELAQVATAALASQAEQGVVRGPVPLTPIQHWFFERDIPQPHHFNQAVMIEARQRVDAGLLEKALARLVEHHDALRLRYVRGEAGWTQENAGLEQPVSLRRLDVSAHAGDEEAQRRAIQAAATDLHKSLRLDEGLLLRALLVERGAGHTERLLLVVHHLAVDGVSWRVLLEDLNTAYTQLRRGVPVSLPSKTTSFQEWARKLEAHARGPAMASELAFWLEGAREVKPLPVDHQGLNTLASANSVRAVLETEETRALLQEVPTAYRAHINDVLLAALTQALAGWTGERRARIHLEGHGREELFADADISRTVGWFTSVYPVLLEVPEGGTPGDGLRAVRDTLRRLPNKGLGYGLVRYLRDADDAAKLKAVPAAQVAFNYLGQFDAMAAGESMFGLAKEPAGPGQGEGGLRTALLEVNGLVINGRLELSWTYSEAVHARATVEALAESFLKSLRTLIANRETQDARRYTPADFPLARLDVPGLAKLHAASPDLDDVYPLSPLQQGMLFHALLEPTSGMYCEQMAWSFHGTVNLPVMRRAWELLVERNAILRTSFVWDGLSEPLQVVHASAELPWRELDWRGLSQAEQQDLFQQYLADDRARGHDVTRAPLMRLTVVRMDDHVLRCLWSIHHLLLDGWSMSLLIQELFSLYRALDQGQSVPRERAVPYREFIAWLQRQDGTRLEAFWKRELAGIHAPTPLPGDERAALARTQHQDHAEKSIRLSAASTTAVDAFVKRHQLTLNTLVQAAWALVLARHSGEQDVVLGATVSGRPSDLPGVERMTGLFINTLPVRVRVPAQEQIVPWLRQLQAQQLELRQYEHSPLVRVQGYSQVPRGTPLFQSLFVFENYPIDSTLSQRASVLEVRDVQGSERSNFPLTASSSPSRELLLKLAYDTPRFEAEGIGRLLEQWRRAVEGLVAGETGRLWEVGVLSAEEKQRVLVEWNQTASDYPREASIVDVFASQVARRPDAVALEAGEEQLTYAQLDAKANQLAHLLKAHGVGPESRVALCLERGVELVVALVAILKAGGAYVPLEADYPRERLAYMLKEAGARVLVTTRTLGERLPTDGLDVVRLEEAREELARQPKHAPASGVGSRNVAYVDFTSGSTGKPKGVCTEHGGVLRTVLKANYARWTKEDTFLLLAPVSFDASTLEVWGPLLSGAKLVVYPPVPVGDVKELEGVLKRHGVTVLHLTAGLFTQMVDGNLEGLRGVKQLLTGGDVVSAPHVKRALETLGVTVTACYGPTEGTLFTSCHRMETVEDVGTVVPIGRPIGDTQVYVLDGQWQPVPVGVVGELYAAGDGLARGYLGQPGLTAQAFLPNPYGPAGSRMYRTGDLARWRADGVLEFQGRADTQVKVRGFRVELGEVEAALAQCEGVRECVVVAKGQGAGTKRLVAYVAGEGLDVA
ncbi:amino acid adenylation domain-containing protein, partial [Corallococcus caeni]|uniref:amino acid adenylation domain-containing protein n=1 Tax=Corallococcus caeni TaxID=3082388 RepID=UPI0030C78454